MRMLVAGEWTDGARQEEVRSPYSGEAIDTVPVAGLDDVERALAGAVRGAAAQRRTTGHEREAILRRAGDIADTRVDELAATISAETGKAITEARAEAGQGVPRGARRARPRRRPAPPLGLRGHAALRRHAAARRGRRRRPEPA